ncbi:InlB B-repeat-containing protein, partial [Methanocorpusculum sp. MG]
MNGMKCPRDTGGLMRRGVVLLAALLLVCTLMAGAVSAESNDGSSVTVTNFEDLIANLSNSTGPTTINLGEDIKAPSQITVNRSVTISGGNNYHTITAVLSNENKWSGTNGQKNLLLIDNSTWKGDRGTVTLKNIRFESNATSAATSTDGEKNTNLGAHGIQAYNTNDSIAITLENLILNDSAGSGLNVNGANVSITNVTIQNSNWTQSIDVSSGKDVQYASNLTIDEMSELKDALPIVNDNQQIGLKATVHSSSNSYTPYDLYIGDENYALQKRVWGKSNFNTADAEAKVVNSSSSSTIPALHANLTKALNSYVDDGATVTQLKEVTLSSDPIVISKNITFDGDKKSITASSIPANGAINITATGDVTLKKLNVTATGGDQNALIKAFVANWPANPTNVPNNLVITESTLTVTGATAPEFDVILARPKVSLVVNKSTITATGSNYVYAVKFIPQTDNAKTLTVQGNTLKVNSTGNKNAAFGVYIAGNTSSLTTEISDNTVTAESSYRTGLLYYTPPKSNTKTAINNNTLTMTAAEAYIQNIQAAMSATVNITVNMTLEKNTVQNTNTTGKLYAVGFAQRANAVGTELTDFLKGTIKEDNTFTSLTGYVNHITTNTNTPITLDTSGLTIEGKTIDLKIVAPYGTGIDLGNTTQTTGTAKKFTVTPAGTSVLWSSSNTSVLTIGADGNYTAKAVGTTTITATGPNEAKATMLITVYQAAEPKLPVSNVEKQDDGSTIISNSSAIEIQSNIATIEDEDAGVVMVVTFEAAPTTESGSIKGNVTMANVTFKEAPAASPKMETSYSIVINLANVTNYLPTIDPVFNETIVEKIQETFSESNKYTFLSMITATGDNVTKINNNVSKSEGIKVTFKIPKSEIQKLVGTKESDVQKIKAFHYKSDGTVSTPLNGRGQWIDNDNYYEFTVTGDSFSSYVLAAYTAPPAPIHTPVSGGSGSGGSGSGNMDGALRVLFNDGSATLSVVTGLSYGDKLTAPANPVKDGYTFAGWYKDEACTQAWSFSDGIPSDMTLYAKWTGGSSSSQSSSQQSG